MNSRTKHSRKAAARVSYVEAGESSESELSDEDASSSGKLMRGGNGGKRSGRRKSVKKSNEDSDGEEVPAKKRKKRRGKGKGKVKVKKELLKTLPAELFAEVLSYCHSGDLLNLFSTSKTYYHLLGSKASASIWRKSRLLIDLPDLPFEGFSEIRYARLALENNKAKCELCNKGGDVYADFYLHIRYVKLRHLKKTDPAYHPLTADVVPCTPTSPALWSAYERFALRGDLEAYSEKLFELENEDDGDIELLRLNSNLSKSGTSSRGRSVGSNAVPCVKTRVALFVEQRKKEVQQTIELFEDVGHYTLRRRMDEQNAHADQAASQARRVSQPDFDVTQPSRSYSTGPLPRPYEWDWWLQQRIRNEMEMSVEAFWMPTMRRSKCVKQVKYKTDEVWEEIGPSVLKAARRAVAACQAKKAAAEMLERRRAQQNKRLQDLRSRYNSLRAEEDDDFTRNSYPLFSTFTAFESVEPFLPVEQSATDDEEDEESDVEEVEISDEEWEAALPLVKEEIAQHRIELILHAAKLILDATTEGEPPTDDEILDNLELYDDSFFSKATSFLVCTHHKCSKPSKWIYRDGTYTHVDRRSIFSGSLSDLLHHQHQLHNGKETYFVSERRPSARISSSAPFHLDLPLPVACAVSALLELGDLDDSTATKEDLDLMDKKAHYEWENTRIHAKWFGDWKDLLDAVYRAANKAAKAGPGHDLPPPCIVYHPRAHYRADNESGEEEEEEDEEDESDDSEC